MKKIFLILLIINYGCSKIDCSKISWIDSNEKIVGINGTPVTGKCKTFYENGKTKSKREYYKGNYHGEWTFYYENGNIETQGVY